MKVTLVHNPDAGGDRKVSADQLLRTIGKAGHAATYQSTKAPEWYKVLDAAADLIETRRLFVGLRPLQVVC